MLKLISLMVLVLSSVSLHATTFTLKSGWNLLGTLAEIPTSQLLAYSNISNIVIYDSSAGVYKSTNNNQINMIPEKSGFFVYSTSNQTINVSTVDLSVIVTKVNRDGAELASDVTRWDILHIKDAGLYLEMKNDFTAGLKYSFSDATNYCSNLLVGSIGGWRLPTLTEQTGISSLYRNPSYSNYFATTVTESNWNDLGNTYGDYNKVYCVQNAP